MLGVEWGKKAEKIQAYLLGSSNAADMLWLLVSVGKPCLNQC